jgi:hypothetical protein
MRLTGHVARMRQMRSAYITSVVLMVVKMSMLVFWIVKFSALKMEAVYSAGLRLSRFEQSTGPLLLKRIKLNVYLYIL